jgi:hypothetical protein
MEEQKDSEQTIWVGYTALHPCVLIAIDIDIIAHRTLRMGLRGSYLLSPRRQSALPPDRRASTSYYVETEKEFEES